MYGIVMGCIKVQIYGSLVLPVVLYGCASWFLTLREENKCCGILSMGGGKRETRGWRKLHNEELHDLCCSSNIISVFRLRRMRILVHVGCMWEGDLHAGF
jgi:hypothetical protein